MQTRATCHQTFSYGNYGIVKHGKRIFRTSPRSVYFCAELSTPNRWNVFCAKREEKFFIRRLSFFCKPSPVWARNLRRNRGKREEEKRGRGKKLKNIYDANGFWCSMVKVKYPSWYTSNPRAAALEIEAAENNLKCGRGRSGKGTAEMWKMRKRFSTLVICIPFLWSSNY